MEAMERFWQTLFKKKKKKKNDNNKSDEAVNKENIHEEPEKVTVKTTVIGDSKTFPRIQSHQQSPLMHSSPRLQRINREANVGLSSTSLKGPRSNDLYDKSKWLSTQHFHVPLGTRPRHASSKGAISMSSVHNCSRRQLTRPVSSNSIRPQTPILDQHNNLRRQVDPYDKIKDHGGVHHFHLPQSSAGRFLYKRSSDRGAMNKLVQSFKSHNKDSSSVSVDQDEPIQLAHYPGGRHQHRSNEELPSIFPFSDKERKRRRSRSCSGSDESVDLQDDFYGGDLIDTTDSKMSGIGKVFLDTIEKTERIRNAKVHQIDPRSAARTPAADKMPKYGLRYESPAWASPSRDTYHGRPWDSEEDVCQPVVLSSSGCASGCASDHLAGARSVTTLLRSAPSLVIPDSAPATLRYSTPIRPGYTQTTLPHIKTVSGRILSFGAGGLSDLDDESGRLSGNTHSGVVSSVNNSFSWATLAKYQEDTLDKGAASRKNTFYKRPDLHHTRTILDI